MPLLVQLVLQDGKVPQNQHSCALANYLTQLVLRLCAVLFQQGSARAGDGDFASLQATYRQLQALCTPTATTSSLIDSGTCLCIRGSQASCES